MSTAKAVFEYDIDRAAAILAELEATPIELRLNTAAVVFRIITRETDDPFPLLPDDSCRPVEAPTEPTDDASEPCGHCTSFRVSEPGDPRVEGAAGAEIVTCRRLEAGMCPSVAPTEPTKEQR